ncbi:MAG TPA: GGDEF domain-containing protein [Burkholderiales bacterium]|nr:GGDEF domain-containing protein [Burkholderiales bacterium]
MAQSSPDLVRKLTRFSGAAGVFALAVGVVVLFGWIFDVAVLKSLAPGLATMKANTAACFAFAGASLWFLAKAGIAVEEGLARRTAILFAVPLVAFAAVTLSQDLFGWNAGIDEYLFSDPASTAAGQPPGRMSPATAICFLLIGGSLLLLEAHDRHAPPAAQGLAAAAGLLAIVALFGASALYGVHPFGSVALHTAVTFLALGTGVLAARPELGWMNQFTRDTPSATMGRRLTLAAFAVLPALGWLGLKGQEAGWYETEFGLAAMVATSTVVLTVLIGFTTRTANVAENKILHLGRVYAVLSKISSLIVRAGSREELFAEACRVAANTGQFPWAWIGVVDREAKQVKIVASAGDDRGLLEILRDQLTLAGPAEELGPTARAVLEKKAIVANDIENDPIMRLKKEAPLRRGIRSLAILPLIVSGEAVGVLALCAEESGFFDADEMKLLLELAADISFALDHLEKAKKLDYLAYYDSLTGLANRTLFQERLEQRVHAAHVEKHKLAVGILDIERFKTINDTLGRHIGDELLKQIGQRLATFPGDLSRIARVGGDLFGVIVPGMKSEEEVARYVEEGNRQCFRLPYRLNGSELRIAAKMGVAIYPNDGGDADALFKHAEAALKNAKVRGEKYLFYTQAMTERIAEKLNLENKLREALEKEEFVLHYQPRVNLETRKIEGMAALLRWKSPDLGMMSPRQFMPMLEETGLILEVGTWALRKAALEHRHCVDQGLPAPPIAVKVSAIQLRQPDFVEVLEKTLAEGAATPGIDLEIGESLIMENIEASIAKLKDARKLGVNIAIDHFGTGYSSLGYLAKLPVQALKIDRSFVFRMLEDSNTMTVVSTIISLAHSLALSVTADGVETEEQAKMLRLLRCDAMQGYVVGKPQPSEEMERLLREPPAPGLASLH